MLIKINDYDITDLITKYEIIDDEPIVLNTMQMADGSIKKILAPYNKTEISITLEFITQARFKAFFDELEEENIVQYYSRKTGEIETAVFFMDRGSYEVTQKTSDLDYTKEYSFTLVKLDGVSL